MATRQGKPTIRKRPVWEGQARAVARQLGVSEAKVTRQVKRELIRIIAGQIAKVEHQRVQDEKYAQRGKAPAVPSRTSEAKVRREKVVIPTDDRPISLPPESPMKTGVSQA